MSESAGAHPASTAPSMDSRSSSHARSKPARFRSAPADLLESGRSRVRRAAIPSSDPGGGFRMAHAALDRADQERADLAALPAAHRRLRHLDRVAKRRARHVCFQSVHTRRRDACPGRRLFNHQLLSRAVRGCWPRTRPVLVDRRTADHRPDAVAVSLCIARPLQYDRAAALAPEGWLRTLLGTCLIGTGGLAVGGLARRMASSILDRRVVEYESPFPVRRIRPWDAVRMTASVPPALLAVGKAGPLRIMVLQLTSATGSH